jgi:hypothetical protein
MAKSKVQFQKGYSLFEFLKDYGSEAQCEKALFAWRFPHGFVCPECANKTFCQLKCRPRVLQCNHCRHQLSLTGNTIFANTKLPLTKWFLAMHLLSQTKTGLSAMELHIPVENEHLFRFKMNADSGLRVHRFRTPQCTYSDVR